MVFASQFGFFYLIGLGLFQLFQWFIAFTMINVVVIHILQLWLMGSNKWLKIITCMIFCSLVSFYFVLEAWYWLYSWGKDKLMLLLHRDSFLIILSVYCIILMCLCQTIRLYWWKQGWVIILVFLSVFILRMLGSRSLILVMLWRDFRQRVGTLVWWIKWHTMVLVCIHEGEFCLINPRDKSNWFKGKLLLVKINRIRQQTKSFQHKKKYFESMFQGSLAAMWWSQHNIFSFICLFM